MECPYCQSSIDEDSHFCDQCGQEIKICVGCGRPGKGKRCIHDGKVLVAVKSQSELPKTVPESTASNPLSIASTAVNGSKPLTDSPDLTHDHDPASLLLINYALNLRITIKHNDLIARTQGPHASTFARFPTVSSQRHILFQYKPDRSWWFEDQNSTNGTKHSVGPVSWTSVAKCAPFVAIRLEDGHRLLIANIEFIVELRPKADQPVSTANTVRL